MADPKAIKLGVKRRKQIMRFLVTFQRKNGYPPTQSEIADGLGVSRTAVRNHLEILVEQGLIKVPPGGRRRIVLNPEAILK